MVKFNKILNTCFKKLIIALLILITAFSFFTNAGNVAVAQEPIINAFDKTDPLEDLRSDPNFSLENFNTNKLQLINLTEYCYSPYVYDNDAYALYVYVFNPLKLTIKTDSENNTIELADVYDKDGEPTSYNKFKLKFCSMSTGNYSNLFLKFKVIDEYGLDGKNIEERVNPDARRYDVSGIELFAGDTIEDIFEGTIEDSKVARTWIYKGFSKGFNPDGSEESTLSCSIEKLETLTLKVKSTYYRPEGHNGKNSYTQDSLHSVYFAVPKVTEDKHGSMYSVHAEWLNAVLKPMLLVGSEKVYNSLKDWEGKSVSGQNVDYTILGNNITIQQGSAFYDYYCYSYGPIPADALLQYYIKDSTFTEPAIDTCYGIFKTDIFKQDRADNYTITSEIINTWAKESLSKYGGDAVLDKYSKKIFEKVDNKFTEVNISADETFDLRNNVLNDNFFNKLFSVGGYYHNYASKDIENRKAIELINPEHITLSQKDFSTKYLTAEEDYNDIKSYVNQYKDTHNVYLFRYMISDYVAQEGTIYSNNSEDVSADRTNARIFKQTCNLNFDILDLGFKSGEDIDVIPCVSNPIDVFHGSTPALETKSDKLIDWWKIVLMVLIAIVGLLLLSPFFPIVFSVLWFIIKIIFKGLWFIVKYVSIGLWYVIKYVAIALWWVIKSPYLLIKAIKERRKK